MDCMLPCVWKIDPAFGLRSISETGMNEQLKRFQKLANASEKREVDIIRQECIYCCYLEEGLLPGAWNFRLSLRF
ncbi:Cellulose synthase operon protein [Trichinella spiralis]|uniref:Cellulose synthase operon protein n=1 Tax=Trichinella spiralis TaxID=6334 RepID=A0ABR3KPE0_TRISP